jgi:hypothetical protein
VEHVEHLKKGLETLRKNYLIANIKKCGSSKHPLVHWGHVIGVGELNIDPTRDHSYVGHSY